MGFRFYKRIKIAPGISMNISKSGVSYSVGPRGMKYTVGSRGSSISMGIPGTGLYYYTKFKKGNQSLPQSKPTINMSSFKYFLSSDDERKFITAMKEYLDGNHTSSFQIFDNSNLPDSKFMCGYICLNNKQYKEAEDYFLKSIEDRDLIGRFASRVLSNEFELLLDITPYISAPIRIDRRSCILALIECYQNQNKYQDIKNIFLNEKDNLDKIMLLSFMEVTMYSQDCEVVNIEEFLRMTEGIANDEVIDTNILYLRAFGYYRMKLREAALKQLTTLVRKKKDRPKGLINQIHYSRATIYKELGKSKEARKDYETVYASDPNFKNVRLMLGIV